MPKFETIKAGDTLYSVEGREKWDYRLWRVFPVKVISVDTEKRTAICSNNSNTPRTYNERSLKTLRRNDPNKKVVLP